MIYFLKNQNFTYFINIRYRLVFKTFSDLFLPVSLNLIKPVKTNN